jgi:hypothetical protein
VCERLPIDEDDTLPDDFHRWAHQKYVAWLVILGEFRVFIATRYGADGTREPYVVHVIRTWWTNAKSERLQEDDAHKPSKLGKHYAAEEVEPQNQWPDYPSINYKKLTKYALHVYCRLQGLQEKGFQSLDVGGRLDIGVAPDGKQFFVNELTRWYGAHHFAIQTQAMPGDKICRAYAQAFAETRGIGLRHVEIEESAANGKKRKAGGGTQTVQAVAEPSVGQKSKKRRCKS